jgi:hypothetical protein
MTNSIDKKRTSYSSGTANIIFLLSDGKVLLENKNIISCYFIEDIFSFCITGKLVFRDMYGIMEFGNFTGNEQLIIVYGEEEDRTILFDIWKINKISQMNPTDPTAENLIEIFFADPSLETYIMKKYSRSWDDTYITSDIVKHILKHMVGLKNSNLNIEKSITSLNFIMQYWTPMKAISWLADRSESFITKTSGYLCFNNTANNFTTNFITLNSLLSYRNETEETPYVFEDSVNMINKNKILDWWISGIDFMGSTKIRGGHWKGFNSLTKSFIDIEYDYKDGINNTILLGKKSLFRDISDSRSTNELVGESDTNRLSNIAYSEWSKRYNSQNFLNLILDGQELRYAGKLIDIKWPSGEREKQKFNKQLYGRYLIKSITHQLFGGKHLQYKQRLVLIKNAYNEMDYKDLLDAKTYNSYPIKGNILKG